MSAVRRLPRISMLLGVVSLGAAIFSKTSTREKVAGLLGVTSPGGTWRLLAVILAVLNLKNLPLVWHIRLFRGLFYHLFLQPTPLPPSALFTPLITPTHTPLLETDYNFHKSNSTYFADLDIARTHLVAAITRHAMHSVGDGTRPEESHVRWSFKNTTRAAGYKEKKSETNSKFEKSHLRTVGQGETKTAAQMTEQEWMEAAKDAGGNLLIALGAVSCHFHREIKPYRRYEIWTRILTWDRKWLYVVSHFVEADTFAPETYILQPWKKGKKRRVEDLTEGDKQRLKKNIFASSIAKYVVKKGRLTIPPEMVLERSKMLPPRPEGVSMLGAWTPVPSRNPSGSNSPERSFSPDADIPGTDADTPSPSPLTNSRNLDHGVLAESLFATAKVEKGQNGEEWSWESVQAERIKGLKYAEAYDMLDSLKDIFDVEGQPNGEVMGQYADLMLGF
ncbi:hypothetical protein E2P81_ATG07544 [Venturia nashicola]|uniref:Capsule polysaccharide biosynthesis protein n=1 Tax=Venturia nashicola TaxID=86259 RepID=A0A4Z1P233_9PEZI|nr:hypothetical protein E6O75_ATG07703 [Venturia nashicola]TLD32054.1 hypothetical protein E2P81_ATG07544 [Venturia nashicola]